MAGQDQLESVPLPGRDDGDAVEESEIAEQAWILRKSLDKRPCERSRIGFRSALLGLIGLAVLLAALASLLVVGASTILEEVEEDELYFIAFLETLYLPSMMAFVYISVVVMFWHRPIWQRFALGFLLVAPGVYLLLQLANLFLDFSWVDAPEILLALLIQFFASSVVGLMAQLWTPWTLSEARGEWAAAATDGHPRAVRVDCRRCGRNRTPDGDPRPSVRRRPHPAVFDSRGLHGIRHPCGRGGEHERIVGDTLVHDGSSRRGL